MNVRHPKLRELGDAVQEFCKCVWIDPTKGKLLVIAGDNGSGKTHTLAAVQRWVQSVGPGRSFTVPGEQFGTLTSRLVRWPEFVSRMKDGHWAAPEELYTPPVVLIDEVGGEHDPSKVGTDALCRVLSRRERKWTMITTNVMPENWEQVFDRRITSRFFRNSTIVDLTGVPDYSLQ